MKRALLTAALLAVAALTPAKAQVTALDDPLHGCQSATTCTEATIGGTKVTPIASNPPVGWGFSISPGPQSGTLFLEFLIPNNDPHGSVTVTGSASLTTSLVSTTAWTSGDLTTYLGISASPPNPLSSWLPATQTVDAGATGYFVQQGIINTITIPGNPPPALTDVFNASALPQGSLIVAFLETSPGTFVSTAQSGGLFVTTGAVPEPSTWAMMLLGFVGLGFAFRQSRRKVSFA
jgi:hypothetical protein